MKKEHWLVSEQKKRDCEYNSKKTQAVRELVGLRYIEFLNFEQNSKNKKFADEAMRDCTDLYWHTYPDNKFGNISWVCSTVLSGHSSKISEWIREDIEVSEYCDLQFLSDSNVFILLYYILTLDFEKFRKRIKVYYDISSLHRSKRIRKYGYNGPARIDPYFHFSDKGMFKLILKHYKIKKSIMKCIPYFVNFQIIKMCNIAWGVLCDASQQSKQESDNYSKSIYQIDLIRDNNYSHRGNLIANKKWVAETLKFLINNKNGDKT